ncbi:two-partner secretion domain-containing protein [Zooshikella harenae]|uniref:Filamentous hemagglutinin N-terminal domain-containing protein n=1 Tax=Zooshikella harenae TaxID=2827238 RepID=A0ABS5ZGH1_9GAMM|nr:filamentous hemagglutinin N-terminal domain-containing protein [Zooshikella harenae]MBU2713080.1 filamentous hemagglutinin N-terminal domain-containing protein [Zooshikella harenae]
MIKQIIASWCKFRNGMNGVLNSSLLALCTIVSSICYGGVSNQITNELSINKNQLAKLIDNEGVDLVKIAATNSYDVSYNKFSSFNTFGKPVKLINDASLNLNLSSRPARVIIIETEDTGGIHLEGKVEVIGQPADLIFVNKTGISCNGCSFNDSPRVVFGTGQIDLTSDGDIDKITVDSGHISIEQGGLEASGATFLDFISYGMSIYGDISTSSKASPLANGEYETDENGSLNIIGGDIQVLLGKNQYKYSSAKSTVLGRIEDDYTALQGNDAKIIAGGIKINSTVFGGKVELPMALSTVGDLTMSSQYRGKNIIPDDAIHIKANGTVIVDGTLTATNQVSIDSTSSIRINKNNTGVPNIMANTVNIAAVEYFTNLGRVSSNKIYVAGLSIVNEGHLEGQEVVYLSGKERVFNQFGGSVLGENIALLSESLIRNGSRKTYKLEPKQKRRRKRSLLVRKPLKEGAFFRNPPDPENTEQVTPDSLKASIIGNNVHVKGSTFENINPYSVICTNNKDLKSNGEHVTARMGSCGDIKIDSLKASQVSVSASSSLFIDSPLTILNSSAIIEVVNGDLKLNTANLINERYHLTTDVRYSVVSIDRNIQHVTDASTRVIVGNEGSALDSSKMASGIGSNNGTAVFGERQFVNILSPAGRIYAGKNGFFKVLEKFENNFSFIEIFGHLNGDIKQFEQKGLQLKKIIVTTRKRVHKSSSCGSKRCSIGMSVSAKEYKSELENGRLLAVLAVGGEVILKGHNNMSVVTINLNDVDAVEAK